MLAAIRLRRRGGGGEGGRAILYRPVLAVACFALAFAIDLHTGKRYSPILGSMAIYGSALTLFPAIRPGLLAATAHGSIWAGFNVARAYADNLSLGVIDLRAISDLERWLFGGTLPSSSLQNHFLDPAQIRLGDVGLGLVHASFFVVPHVIGAIAWRHGHGLFLRYLKATACCFGLSLAAFILLPTAPPWMSDPDHVTRTAHTLMSRAGVGLGSGSSTGTGEAFWFEPNAVAALPSVHVAVSVLVAMALRSLGGWVKVAGGVYPLAMSVAVVYLGEHFVLDVVTGWVVALVAWRMARPGQRAFPAWVSRPRFLKRDGPPVATA